MCPKLKGQSRLLFRTPRPGSSAFGKSRRVQNKFFEPSLPVDIRKPSASIQPPHTLSTAFVRLESLLAPTTVLATLQRMLVDCPRSARSAHPPRFVPICRVFPLRHQ